MKFECKFFDIIIGKLDAQIIFTVKLVAKGRENQPPFRIPKIKQTNRYFPLSTTINIGKYDAL